MITDQDYTKEELVKELQNLQLKYKSLNELYEKDKTEHKKAEEELRASQQLLEGIINSISVRVFWKDKDLRYLGCNQVFAQDAGFTHPSDLIGKNDFQMGWRDQAELYRSGDRQVMESGIPILLNEEPQTTPEGKTIILLTNKIPLKNAKGEIYGILGTSMNVTERTAAVQQIKLQNEELQKINAEKDKFFSIIAHDLKSPFNTIIGFSDLLSEHIREKDLNRIEEFADYIKQSSYRAMNLLMNLMEWSRSQTGRMDFNPEHFNLADIVNENLLLVSDRAVQKSIAIKNTFAANKPVFADKAMISTILRNLITNSIKFTRTGGEILISVKEEQERLIVSVHDTGVGIPQNALDKLFRLDKNYSTSGTENEQGTGLGLILCKDFIDKHKGEIWVESHEGEGSTFFFSIPSVK